MRTDAPEDHTDLVFRVIFDRQAADHHETTLILDLASDLVDDWEQ
jgi:hypothetical protein